MENRQFFETKNSNLNSVNDVDLSKRVVTGYLSSFGVKDRHNDIIREGAFQKSLNERRDSIMFLNQHNWSQPHGTFSVLKEDKFGLYFESNPLPDTSYSNDVIKLYDAGILNQHSIGFQTIEKEFNKKENARVLKELKLFEGSNVTMGANANTPFLGKKATFDEIKTQSKKIIKELKSGTYTDETFCLLEIALEQLQQKAYILGQKSLEEKNNEPITITQPVISLADIVNTHNKKYI